MTKLYLSCWFPFTPLLHYTALVQIDFIYFGLLPLICLTEERDNSNMSFFFFFFEIMYARPMVYVDKKK